MTIDLDAMYRMHTTVYDGAVRLLTEGKVPDAESAAMMSHSTWKAVGVLLAQDQREARERRRQAMEGELRSRGNSG